MNGNSIPKHKKKIDTTAIKRSQSEDLLNKTTKRKPASKKFVQTSMSKSTLVQSGSIPKVTKSTLSKKKKEKPTKLKKKASKQKSKQSQKQNTVPNAGESSTKTVKKMQKKKKQKQEELTQRKRIHLEYFMYRDVYLPIENTEQRKIIYKIQLIDEKVVKQSRLCPVERRSGEGQKVDMAIQKTDRKGENADFQCQTQVEVQVEKKDQDHVQEKKEKPEPAQFQEQFQQQTEKCFAETLSQLQFLFLPDEKNFQNFTKSQKAHYKQLLLYIAKKFDEPTQKILDEQTVQSILQQRYLKQRGINESFPKKGIPTHTPSIISYVTNLFCFLEISQKASFIDRINCSYGYTMSERLARVRTGRSTRLPSRLISEATFWKFETQLHQGLEFESDTIESALHAHNRAVFDAVNETLLQFQPYYSCQGQPFPWSQNFQTTFYCISEQSFSALVCQIKDKIWQQSTTLAGILLETDSNRAYKAHYNKILAIEQQLIHGEIRRYSDRVEMDQGRTRVLVQVAGFVEGELVGEIVGLLMMMMGV